MKLIASIFKKIDKLLFPEYKCFVCGRESQDTKNRLCEKCKLEFPYIKGKVCKKCGMTIDKNNSICDTCKQSSFKFESARASFYYNKMTHTLLYQLKYGGKKFIANYFGELIFETYKDWGIHADIVIPVPLHIKRQKVRGYNQSEIIAERFCELSDIPMDTDIIYRTQETPNQTKLTKAQREKNLQGAFEINYRKELMGKTLLIIDDMFTTGSTVNEMSKLLLKFKPKSIYVLTPGKTYYAPLGSNQSSQRVI